MSLIGKNSCRPPERVVDVDHEQLVQTQTAVRDKRPLSRCRSLKLRKSCASRNEP